MNTLQEWKSVIGKEVPYVDVKPYSHNIISIALMAIAKEYSYKEANEIIEEFNLESLGWKKVYESGKMKK